MMTLCYEIQNMNIVAVQRSKEKADIKWEMLSQ